MLSKLDSILNTIDSWVWGIPLIVLILTTGVILTIRTSGIQFKKLARALKSIMHKSDSATGEVSSFGALCTALSATIGTGNIVGVATAIAAGGPGALFWMWLAALLGMATKYAECMLAVKYREVKPDGHILGGPFYTIEKGLGPKFIWLAKLFAVFAVMAGLLGIGTMTQVNGITSAVNNAFDPDNLHTVSIFGQAVSWSVVIAGLLVTAAAALVIIGGLRRISKVAQVVVPFMAALYVVLGVFVLLFNFGSIDDAFQEIFRSAFGARAAAGGALGAMIAAMQKGVARGIFSNEAGLGSAPIAASAAQTEEPVAQGLVSMTGTFIDTIIICTITGLAIVIAGEGLWSQYSGVELSTKAFQQLYCGMFAGGAPMLSNVIKFAIMISLVFFAFTTILGWDYYSERCLEYLCHGNMKIVTGYRWLYIIAVFIGPYMTLNMVWTIADITNALMALPNIVSLIALSGVTAKMTKDYFDRYPKLDAIEDIA
ncbi:MAG: alanine:cation symporter family protein [Treponemataceae bacterium]|nr:alanine:cation symporter family protein [Treponemataceae bacterium]